MRLLTPVAAAAVSGALVMSLLAASPAFVPPSAHASGPVIALSPPLNLPHGIEAISGSGFDPGGAVDVTVQSSGTFNDLGEVPVDASGAISASITLPYTLDAGLANTVAVTQTGTSIGTSASVLGAAVMPVAGSGPISAHAGDSVRFPVAGFAPSDPLTILVDGLPAVLPPGTAQYDADATGAADLSFSVPGFAQAGAAQIVVRGQAAGVGQHDSTSVPINIAGAGTLVVTPNPAMAGQNVQVAAAGFISRGAGHSLSAMSITAPGGSPSRSRCLRRPEWPTRRRICGTHVRHCRHHRDAGGTWGRIRHDSEPSRGHSRATYHLRTTAGSGGGLHCSAGWEGL